MNFPAPQFILPRDFPPARLYSYACLYCDFVASAASEQAAMGAMDAHARYINAHADRETDDHFEDLRLEALI